MHKKTPRQLLQASLRTTGLALLVLMVILLPLPSQGARGSPAEAPSTQFTLSQWSDVQNQWQNGDLNAQNSAYHEGQSVPFKIDITNAEPGTTYTFGVHYDCNRSGASSYDFLTRYNRDRSPTAPSGSPVTAPISDDPSIAYDNADGSRVWSLWGATFNGAPAGPNPSSLCSSTGEKSYTVSVIANSASATLAWGGHLASPLDWGAGKGAASVSGAPFHMQFDCPSNGTCSRDRSIQPSAIIATPGPITAHKFSDLNGNGTQDSGEPNLAGWTMTLTPGNLSGTTGADGNYTFSDVMPGDYTVAETLQAGWTNVTPASVSVTLLSGGSAVVNFGNRQVGPTATPTPQATVSPTPTGTVPPVAPTATPTSLPPTLTPTNTPVVPVPTPTNTPVMPVATPTNTPVAPVPTPTNIPATPSPTPMGTIVPAAPTPAPTATPTSTPVIPVATPTATPVTPAPAMPSPTPTAVPSNPTATPVPPTATPVPPTATPVPGPSNPDPTATPVPPTPTPAPEEDLPEPAPEPEAPPPAPAPVSPSPVVTVPVTQVLPSVSQVPAPQPAAPQAPKPATEVLARVQELPNSGDVALIGALDYPGLADIKLATPPDPMPVLLPSINGPKAPAAERIVIPSIRVDSMVMELGIKQERGKLVWETPDHAVGHLQGTANPGEGGNTVLTGHMSSPVKGEGDIFNRLPKVKVGDLVFVQSDLGVLPYVVQETKVVRPSDTWVMYPTKSETLTLVTCYPDLVYTYRYVVTATPAFFGGIGAP